MVAYDRPPNFTDRILQETGTGFAIGALGSVPYQFFKGVATMPRGSRITGGADYVRMHAPRTAGSFAVWMSLFSAANCAAAHLRRKEDPWNTIIAGASAMAILSLRQGSGAVPIMKSVVSTGLFMGLCEGIMLFNERIRLSTKLNNANKVHVPVPVPVPKEASSSSGFLQTWFNSGKKEDELKVDDSSTPMSNF